MEKYRGIAWNTTSELSFKLGKSQSYVHSRYVNKGETPEQVIDFVLDNSFYYKGFSWIEDIDLNRQLNLGKNYVQNRVKLFGYTYKQIIDEFIQKNGGIHQYKGYTWATENQLVGLLDQNIPKLKAKGYTVEEIIDKFGDDVTVQQIMEQCCKSVDELNVPQTETKTKDKMQQKQIIPIDKVNYKLMTELLSEINWHDKRKYKEINPDNIEHFLNKIFNIVSEKEFNVILLRYGIKGKRFTYKTLCTLYGLSENSQDVISRIEDTGLTKLRNHQDRFLSI